MTTYITTDQLHLAQLNTQLELTETFLRLHVQSLWYIAVQAEKVRDYDRLHGDYNRLMWTAQQAQAWRDENDFLWLVIEELVEELRECQRSKDYVTTA